MRASGVTGGGRHGDATAVVAAVSGLVAKRPLLRELHIAGLLLGDAAVVAVCSALARTATTSGKPPALRKLSIGDNGIRAPGLAALHNCLAANTALVHLAVSLDDDVDSGGLLDIIDGHPGLRFLGLSAWCVTSEQAVAVARAVQQLPRLRVLRLGSWWGPFLDGAAVAAVAAAAAQKPLRELMLWQIEPVQAAVLAPALVSLRPTLRTLCVSAGQAHARETDTCAWLADMVPGMRMRNLL